MAIIPSIVKWFNSNRLKQIEHFKKYPVETQQDVLFKLIESAMQTEWGKKYDYSSVHSVSEYQSRLPVRSYEEYLPFIERIQKGEKNLIWPGAIK